MPLVALLAVCVLALPLLPATARAQEDIAVSCEQIAARCPDAEISEIVLDHRDIFEASDRLPSWFPWSAANHLHINTTEGTIRANLLFQTGERLDVDRIRETVRKLSSLGYFQKEAISCREVSPGKVQVKVDLKENWSLIPILYFQGEGQATAVTAGFSEQNLLGLGKILSFSYRNGAQDQNTVIEEAWKISYQDLNILNSEYRLAWTIEGHDSGQTLQASFEKPFFSLETPWSLSVSNSYLEQTAYLYQGGGIVADYGELYDAARIDFGYALKRGPPVVHRVRVFYRHEDQTISDFRRLAQVSPPVSPPPDYTYSYPGVGYRRLGVNYILEQRINRFERDEFFNIANDLQASAGFSAEWLGATRDEWVLSFSDAQGYRFRKGHFLQASVSANGFLDGDRVRNGVVQFTYDHYLLDTFLDVGPFQHTLQAEVSLAYGENLDSDQVLALGYTNGLRGYDYYAFTGNKLFRLSVEDRVYVKKQLFGLIALGCLVFADTGYVWLPGEDPEFADLRCDVGFGLRTAVPSASGANVVRLNWGFPVGAGASPLDEMIFTATVGSTFN